MHTLTLSVTLALTLALGSPAAARSKAALLPNLIKHNAAKVVSAARRAGGQLEIHRGRVYRLLVNDRGKLLYQKVNAGSSVKPKPVRWWGAFRTFKLATPSDGQLQERFEKLVLTPRSKPQPKSEPAQLKAILPDGRKVAPDISITLYHGTDKVSPEQALARGLPARGTDWRLKEHAEPNAAVKKNSAFRGTTQVVADPISGNGAAYWADKGGWVYKIVGVGGWDVNAQLNGRVAKLSGYRGNLMSGEAEIAIPAQVPAKFIKAYGKVQQNSQGKLYVRDWVPNPGFVGH